MEKIDYRKQYRGLYSPKSTAVEEVVVPAFWFAMVSGQGSPDGPDATPEFQNAIGALYGVSYGLKFGRKRSGVGPDYTLGPLEGLWWMNDGSEFDSDRPQDWRWTLMIMQPDFITPAEFRNVSTELEYKKPNPALHDMVLKTFDEGRAVQIMHVGPYDAEGPALQKLEEYCRQKGYLMRGKHHEIYLGDPRRARPERLRTILRHPIS